MIRPDHESDHKDNKPLESGVATEAGTKTGKQSIQKFYHSTSQSQTNGVNWKHDNPGDFISYLLW
jgi:hypothetical protein